MPHCPAILLSPLLILLFLPCLSIQSEMVLIGPWCCWLSSNDKSRIANWGREGRSETKVEIDIIDTTFSLFRRLVVLGSALPFSLILATPTAAHLCNHTPTKLWPTSLTGAICSASPSSQQEAMRLRRREFWVHRWGNLKESKGTSINHDEFRFRP